MGDLTRGLFFLILILGGVWLVADELAGKKRISAFVKGVFAGGSS